MRTVKFVVPECDVILADKFQRCRRSQFKPDIDFSQSVTIRYVILIPLPGKETVESSIPQFVIDHHVDVIAPEFRLVDGLKRFRERLRLKIIVRNHFTFYFN